METMKLSMLWGQVMSEEIMGEFFDDCLYFNTITLFLTLLEIFWLLLLSLGSFVIWKIWIYPTSQDLYFRQCVSIRQVLNMARYSRGSSSPSLRKVICDPTSFFGGAHFAFLGIVAELVCARRNVFRTTKERAVSLIWMMGPFSANRSIK